MDRRLDLWPGAAEVWHFVGARRTTRYQAQHSVDEFWMRTRTAACAQTCARYILRNGFMWESGKKGVEVFVGTLRLASKVAPRSVVEDRAGRGLPVASTIPAFRVPRLATPNSASPRDPRARAPMPDSCSSFLPRHVWMNPFSAFPHVAWVHHYNGWTYRHSAVLV